MDHLVLALILSCSVHPDDNLVEALAAKLSLNNQFFVGDLSSLDTYDSAKSADEAARIVSAIQARGGRPAVGYLALPVTWGPRFGRSLADLFDGCTNIGIGTAMLSDYARVCRPARRPGRRQPGRRRQPTLAERSCLLHRLEADMNLRGIAEHVLPVVAKLDVVPDDRGSDPPPARSAVFPDDTDNGDDHHEWSSSRLFVSPSATMPRTGAAGAAGGRAPAVPAPPPSPSSRPGRWEASSRPPERP